MSKEKCEFCDYTSSRKYNLERHIKNKHKIPPNVAQDPPKVALDPPKVAQDPPKVAQDPHKTEYCCDDCGASFTRKDSLNKHLKKGRCDGTANTCECPLCHTIFSSRYSKCRHLKGCEGIRQVSIDESTTNNITNNTINTTVNSNSNNTIHVHINNFGEENTSYLTHDFLMKCFDAEISGVNAVTEKIYFDDHHPENHNVRLTSLKHAIAEVYKDNKWIPKGLHDIIERMIMKSVCLLTSTVANTTEPTPDRLKTMGNLQELKGKRKVNLVSSTKGNLVARRHKP